MIGSNVSNDASVKLYIRDLLEKKVVDESDIIIIEDRDNTKRITVENFVKSMVKDDDVPTRYRIYSSEKIQNMIDDLENLLQDDINEVVIKSNKLEKEKADKIELVNMKNALIAEIDKMANSDTILEILDSKRDKDIKISSADLDTSSDEAKLGLENFKDEVLEYMTGGTPIPSNRPPKGGWVTEDIADGAIDFRKLSEDYRYGGHFTEGNVNDFTKDGVYTLGSNIIGLPKEDENDKQIRLLTVTVTNDTIKQVVEYENDLEYRPIYRRVATRNRLRVTDFIKVEEINNKFKAHRDLLSDDFNNCGNLSGCDIYAITREGHYLTDETVTNLPSFSVYEVDIKKFGDRVLYQATNIGNRRCDIYQSMQYYTTGMNPVNTPWFNISSFSRSKFEGKTVHIFGDGVIFGLGASDIPNNSVTALLNSKYGLRVINNALGDATAGAYDDETLMERSLNTQIILDPLDDADYVIIMIGTHDWDSGKASIGKDDSVANTSYKGALSLAIRNIMSKNARAKILFATPTFRSRIKIGDGKNSDEYAVNDLYLEDFVNAMKDIADIYHIPCVDLYHDGGINKLCSAAYLKDGLYLSDEGHELIADKLMNAMNIYY